MTPAPAPAPALVAEPEPPAPALGDPGGWAPTPALRRALLVAASLVLLGVLFGRVDLVVLGVPFAVGTVLSLARRPRSAPVLEMSTVESSAVEGGTVSVTVRLANPDPVGYDAALVRLAVPRWLRLRDADSPVVLAVGPGEDAGVVRTGPAQRWGRHLLGPARAQVVSCGGLLASEVVQIPAVALPVYPVTEPFRADDAMPRAAGLIGQHRSRRPGGGGELAGVREFAPGDRLRRIDWRVTLRTQRLHVAATLSDRDAEVVLLLDALHEAGESGGIGGRASVLDTAVRAAAAIAEHYLQRGDRVSLLEYGLQPRRLRPASGGRQYLAVLEWLLDVGSSRGDPGSSTGVFDTRLLSPNALVVVLTPLLDPRSAVVLARLARAGRFVVAVDTLSVGIAAPVSGSTGADAAAAWGPLARRLWRLERENLIGALREHGVPVVAWAGAGSLDQVLRDVSRLAGAARPVLERIT